MIDAKFDFWIQNNYNVLFTGKHGVGKTARIIDAFNRNNIKYKYFSASTLDPWVDFVGVPKEVKGENGNSYLDLIRPKSFSEDEVEAIFLDEYNRSFPKVRNATMELIQFKSINGKKFKNLRFIWAAINPENEEGDATNPIYDVEKLDPAQKDRFEIQVNVPYKADISYFCSKYGDDIGKTAVNWWNDLSDVEKNEISPRRLDFGLNVYSKGGDLRDVFSKKINTSKLIIELKNGSFREQMNKILDEKNETKAREFMMNENSYNNTIKYIVKDKNILEFFFKYIPEEKQNNLIVTDDSVMKFAMDHIEEYQSIITNLSKTNQKVQRTYAKFLKNKPFDISNFKKFSYINHKFHKIPYPKYTHGGYDSFEKLLSIETSSAISSNSTAMRKSLYKSIISYICHERNPIKNINKKILTKNECELILVALNTIIESTTVFDGYLHIVPLYGFVSREYAQFFGETQKYELLSKKVHEFLNNHGESFL